MLPLPGSTSLRRVLGGALLLALAGCNGIFGLEQGSIGSDTSIAGGGTGAATGGTTTTPAITTTTTMASGGMGGTTTTTTPTDSGDAGGASTCTAPDTTACNGNILEVCDSSGQLSSIACDSVAACDAAAATCHALGTYPRLSLSAGVGCAIEDDRTVRCWGDNYGGTLFVGDPNPAEPSAVAIAGATGARQISIANDHGCYIVDSGEVVCWGESDAYQLGIQGVGTNPSPPVTVWSMGAPLVGAVEVAVLGSCSCARMADGAVQCWGYRGNGCFGDASTANQNQEYPTQIAGISQAAQIRAGVDGDVLCVREATGTVSCWSPSIAVSQIPGVTDAIDVASGNGLVFIRSASQGVLSAAPEPDGSGWMAPLVYGAAGAITTMAAGDSFCGLEAGTEVMCALLEGSNQTPDPVSLSGQPAGTVVELAAGESVLYGQDGYQCLRLSGPIAGNVYCWGSDGADALGDGAPEIYPSFAEAGVSNVVALSAAQSSTLAVLADGSIDFWGASESFGSTPVATPTAVPALGTNNVGAWSSDTQGTAYVLETGGAPLFVTSAGPMPGAGLAASGFTDFVEVRPFGLYDIGLRAGGTIVVHAWNTSANVTGVFGDGTTVATVGETETVPGITSAVAFAPYLDDYDSSPSHVCAILGPSGSVSCWGGNLAGELGIGGTTGNDVPTPTAVSLPAGESAVSIAAGALFTCVAAASGKVYCWGDNTAGQLGSSGSGSTVPVQVPGIAGAVGVTARSDFACAWLSDGTAQCWGDNAFGQLGNGTFSLTSTPGPVAGLTNVAKVSAGSLHACALRSDGSVVCWGDSYNGQVGAGLTGIAPEPQPVKGL